MTPVVSVIVPVYRHWSRVPELLDALDRQTMARDQFEVILVNNGPEPVPELPDSIRLLSCPRAGSYAARNLGAQNARGTWLAFTDADCAPDARWLAAIVEGMNQRDAILAGRVVMSVSGRANWWSSYDAVRGIPQERYVRRGYAATANLALSNAAFTRLGGFDSARLSGGDAEFCRRAARLGLPILYSDAATVAHPARRSWEDVAIKARRIRGGQVRNGSAPRRIAWIILSFAPPLRDALRLARSTGHAPRDRARAALVRLALWPVELWETLRLLAGRPPERR